MTDSPCGQCRIEFNFIKGIFDFDEALLIHSIDALSIGDHIRHQWLSVRRPVRQPEPGFTRRTVDGGEPTEKIRMLCDSPPGQ
ncbi:hypothetical protein D3C86_1961210 [compost metagenome]